MIDVEPMILEELHQLAPLEYTPRDWQDAVQRAHRGTDADGRETAAARHPGRTRRLTPRASLVAAAGIAALVIATIAVAAAGRWHFFSDGAFVTLNPKTGKIVTRGVGGRAVTTVRYDRHLWRIEVYLTPGGIGAALYGPHNELKADSAGALPVSSRTRNRIAYLAYSARPEQGTILFGAASPDTVGIRVSAGGRSWTAAPIRVAPILHTTTTVWQIVIPVSRLSQIEAINRNGKVTERINLRFGNRP